MPIPHEHDGAHEAIENFLKDGIMLVTQYAKHHKAQRLATQTEAARQDHELKIAGHQARFQHDLAAKLSLEHASAAMRYSQVNKREFWDDADAATILDTYKDATLHAEQDPDAVQAVEIMADYMESHLRIDVDEVSKAAEAIDGTNQLGEQHVDHAYEDHLESGRDLAGSDQSRGHSSDIGRKIAGLEQQFTRKSNIGALTARLRDLRLSQALAATGSPHTIDQVADAADSDAEMPYARHAAPEADLAGERDNLNR